MGIQRFQGLIVVLNDLWKRNGKTQGSLPIIARVVLELTLMVHGEYVFKYARGIILHPSDLNDPTILGPLYRKTREIEDQVGWWVATIVFILLTSGSTEWAIHVVHHLPTLVVLCGWLSFLAIVFLVRREIMQAVSEWIRRKSYAHILYDFLYHH